MSIQNQGLFRIASDGVAPDLVPSKPLYTGAKIPAIGLGTFGSDNYQGSEVASAVVEAASVGYRHFDCASVYGNEDLIGGALQAIQGGGVKREEMWVTSKVWNDRHDDVVASCKQSLADLRLDYLISIWFIGLFPIFMLRVWTRRPAILMPGLISTKTI